MTAAADLDEADSPTTRDDTAIPRNYDDDEVRILAIPRVGTQSSNVMILARAFAAEEPRGGRGADESLLAICTDEVGLGARSVCLDSFTLTLLLRALADRPDHFVMARRSVGRAVGATLVVLAVFIIAVGHVVFGLGNFRPGYPVGEAVAAIAAGASLLVALALALVRRSVFAALITACAGTLTLFGWFLYGVPIQRSSSPTFLWLSAILPVITGVSAVVVHRRAASL